MVPKSSLYRLALPWLILSAGSGQFTCSRSVRLGAGVPTETAIAPAPAPARSNVDSVANAKRPNETSFDSLDFRRLADGQENAKAIRRDQDESLGSVVMADGFSVVRAPRDKLMQRPLSTMAMAPMSSAMTNVPADDNRLTGVASPPPIPASESRPATANAGTMPTSVVVQRTPTTQRTKTYRAGKLTYDLPDTLRVNQTYKAFLTISDSGTLTQADIRRVVDQYMQRMHVPHQNRIRNDSTVRLPVEGVVQASLTCVSGNAADLIISPLQSDLRTLDTTDFTTHTWMWNVIARQPGTYELDLRVAVGRGAGQPSLDEFPFDQPVIVEALPPAKTTPLSTGERIVHKVETVATDVNLFWDSWGSKGLTGTALTALFAFVSRKIAVWWKRRKRGSPTEPQSADPTELS